MCEEFQKVPQQANIQSDSLSFDLDDNNFFSSQINPENIFNSEVKDSSEIQLASKILCFPFNLDFFKLIFLKDEKDPELIDPFCTVILGDIEGGNTIEDITFVIRVIATALLVIPSLSISRGYLQGNKYITSPSISQVVEQLFRVIVVVVGSYIMLKITGNVTHAVSVACFGATIGGLIAYFYLKYKIVKNKKEFIPKEKETEEEKKISTKEIWTKIFKYAFPFVMIDVVGNACMLINMFTVVKILVNYCNFNVTDAETVMSSLTTWGSKLCMIVSAIATGLVVSLLPNITDS